MRKIFLIAALFSLFVAAQAQIKDFKNVVIRGNLTVQGTTIAVDTTNYLVSDTIEVDSINANEVYSDSVLTGVIRGTTVTIKTGGTTRVAVDAQGDLNISGGRGVNSLADADMWAAFIPGDAQQALSGEGAVNVTSYYTAWTTTGADTATLASGTQIGQLKKIKMAVDAATSIVTLTGYTKITFDDVGDSVILQWNGSAWKAVEVDGAALTP